MGEGREDGRLFATEQAKGRFAYRLYASSMVVGICLTWCYRFTHLASARGVERWASMGLFASELWFSFYWLLTQSVRWNPTRHSTFKDRLTSELPAVDVFVCTADPQAEPPGLVVSTVLSAMAYDYPPEKLSVYLSDDGGSVLTFYALWEASRFAQRWLPFCRRYAVEPRSPAAYFSHELGGASATCGCKEWSDMKELYEEMANRINSVVSAGKIPEEIKAKHKGFSEWNSETTSRNHHPIIQVLIDGKDEIAIDDDGHALPMLVYMAREKRPKHHHNFKAGAMNALIRVSSVMSNGPIILNVDCDMYSNNAASIKDALCFFLDEEMGHKIGFVQYPQTYGNMTKNDIYGNALDVINGVELPGLDSWGGPLYIGTGCFHRREALCGRRFNKDYNEDWSRGAERKAGGAKEWEERAKSLATCTYEHNTPWGDEVGLKYGCAVEDVITGLLIQCRGWKSIYFNPQRAAFQGVAPATLAQTLMQHKRWSEGNHQIFLSKHCPFLLGHGRLKLGLQMGYSIYGLWAANSFPTLYYVSIPPLCLLKGISLFPKMTSLWFIPFAYVPAAKYVYSLLESSRHGLTSKGWWNLQRMWLIKRTTSYLYGTIDTYGKLLGLSRTSFTITEKISGGDASRRYEQEIMEFGPYSPMLVIIAVVALLNLVCLIGGLHRSAADGWADGLDRLFLQVVLCGLIVIINMPVYEGLFLRKDKGSIPPSVTLISLGLVVPAWLVTML